MSAPSARGAKQGRHMSEQWLAVVGFESRYAVSSHQICEAARAWRAAREGR